MKFKQLPAHQAGSLSIQSLRDTLNGRNAGRLSACWVSDCRKVVVVTREWLKDDSLMGPCCTVDVFATNTYLLGFHCKMDGSVAFVFNELMERLTNYKFVGYNALKQFLMRAGLDMSDHGNSNITLSSFHKYKEGQ